MKLEMANEAVKAQIDVCGKMVAYCASNAHGIVSNDVMWDLNQAIISLEHAYKSLGGE